MVTVFALGVGAIGRLTQLLRLKQARRKGKTAERRLGQEMEESSWSWPLGEAGSYSRGKKKGGLGAELNELAKMSLVLALSSNQKGEW